MFMSDNRASIWMVDRLLKFKEVFRARGYGDYIVGMTDGYCTSVPRLFLPNRKEFGYKTIL